jgi:hypothetical protein
MSLPLKTWVWNNDYPSTVTIVGQGKDQTPNSLGDCFEDIWLDDLIHAQAVRASFLLESNAGFDLWVFPCTPA